MRESYHVDKVFSPGDNLAVVDTTHGCWQGCVIICPFGSRRLGQASRGLCVSGTAHRVADGDRVLCVVPLIPLLRLCLCVRLLPGP